MNTVTKSITLIPSHTRDNSHKILQTSKIKGLEIEMIGSRKCLDDEL